MFGSIHRSAVQISVAVKTALCFIPGHGGGHGSPCQQVRQVISFELVHVGKDGLAFRRFFILVGPLQHPFFRLFRGDKERNNQFRHLIRTQQILPDQFAAAEVTGTGSLPCFEDHLGTAGGTGVLFQSLARRTGFYILFVQVALRERRSFYKKYEGDSFSFGFPPWRRAPFHKFVIDTVRLVSNLHYITTGRKIVKNTEIM